MLQLAVKTWNLLKVNKALIANTFPEPSNSYIILFKFITRQWIIYAKKSTTFCTSNLDDNVN